ncbi:MAG: class I SAM-dependent methyltransferase [bacterium]|nr:class I SAM-dependent methyltransferase [bacterium]
MTVSPEMEKQLERVGKAYDLTLVRYRAGFDPTTELPAEIRDNPAFEDFVEESREHCNSGNPDIRAYLNPQQGTSFLDLGCSANLANYDPGDWPSEYYGVDISAALVGAMTAYARNEGTILGGLWTGDISNLPFEDGFFYIAACIGVLEYCTLDYIETSLRELRRVLKTGARAVLDIPNREHRHYPIMAAVEESLGRPIMEYSPAEFEGILSPLFEVDKVSDKYVMLKYFVRSV